MDFLTLLLTLIATAILLYACCYLTFVIMAIIETITDFVKKLVRNN